MLYILLQELAEEFGIDRSGLLKWLRMNPFPTHPPRAPGTRGQAAFAVTPEVADEMRALRREQGFTVKVEPGNSPSGGERPEETPPSTDYFYAHDAIKAGLLTEATLKGLNRSQVKELIDGQKAIYDAEMKVARQNGENAEWARQRAATVASEAERRRQEAQAKVYQRQAETHKQQAVRKAKDFGEEGADLFRSGEGKSTVRDRVRDLKPQIEPPRKVHTVDDLADRIANRLGRIANRGDSLSLDFEFLKKIVKKSPDDMSEYVAKGLCHSIDALIARLERMKAAITTTRCDVDRTEGSHAQRAITTNQEILR